MKKKIAMLLVTSMMAASLVACTGDNIEVEGNTLPTVEDNTQVEEVVETESSSEVAPSEEIAESSVPESTEVVVESEETSSTEIETTEEISSVIVKEGDFTPKAPIRLANSYDEEIVALNEDELSSWWASMNAVCVTFPSTKDVEKEATEEILSEDEFSKYMKDYCDIWDNEDDSWSVSQENFTFHHDYFQNIAWTGQDDIHYFFVESNDFRLNEALEVDDERVLYNDETDTLYLYLVYDYDYEEYVEMSNKDLAATLEEMTCSNRVLMALEFDHSEQLPVEEIVLVKPSGLEGTKYNENEYKMVEIPKKVVSKVEEEGYEDFLGNHVFTYKEYEAYCKQYGIEKKYSETSHKYAVFAGVTDGKYKDFSIGSVEFDKTSLFIDATKNTVEESEEQFGYVVVVPCYDYTMNVFMEITSISME